jgi:hypothetical protein
MEKDRDVDLRKKNYPSTKTKQSEFNSTDAILEEQ